MKYNKNILEEKQKEQSSITSSLEEEILYKDFTKRRTISVLAVRGETNENKEFLFNHMMEQLCLPNKNGEKLPITIKISNYGGEVESGFSIMSSILSARESGYEVLARVYGKAMSIAILPTIVSSKRYAQKNTKFMIHNPSELAMGFYSAEQYKRTSEEMRSILKRYKDSILKYTKIKKEVLERAFDRDAELSFYSEEALELGFIDGYI